MRLRDLTEFLAPSFGLPRGHCRRLQGVKWWRVARSLSLPLCASQRTFRTGISWDAWSAWFKVIVGKIRHGCDFQGLSSQGALKLSSRPPLGAGFLQPSPGWGLPAPLSCPSLSPQPISAHGRCSRVWCSALQQQNGTWGAWQGSHRAAHSRLCPCSPAGRTGAGTASPRGL